MIQMGLGEYDLKTLERTRNFYRKDGCFIWKGTLNNQGRPMIGYRGGTRLVHMIRYLLLVGEYDRALDLDHFKCQNILCVNEKHLEPITHRINTLRRKSKGDENYCVAGHPRTEKNTYTYLRHKKTRQKPYIETQCRPCMKNNTKKYTTKK